MHMWFDVQHLKMIQNSCELHLQAILIAGIAEKVLCTSLYFQISYLTAASHHNCASCLWWTIGRATLWLSNKVF